MNPSTWITVLSILGLLVVISFYVTKSSYHPAYVYGDGNTSASADFLEQKQSKPGKMKQIRILTFGDSLTAGFHNRGLSFAPYGEFLEAKLQSQGYRSLEVETIGFSAWTTRQMVDKMDFDRGRDGVGKTWPGLKLVLEDDRAKKKQFDLVIVMAGTNDIGHGYEREEIVSNLKTLFKLCKDHGVPKLLSIGIPESGYLSHVQSAKTLRDDINRDLKDHAASSGGFITYQDSPFPYDSSSGLFEPDNLHFSPKGYKKFSDGIYENVLNLVEQLSK